MLIKLFPNQIDTYKEVIEECIYRSMPGYEEKIKTDLYKELLLNLAQAWIYYNDDNEFKCVLVTQVRESISIGYKTLTLVCMHAPESVTDEAFINSWPTLQAFGRKHKCKKFDFYSNNERALRYARLFELALETTYIQINIT